MLRSGAVSSSLTISLTTCAWIATKCVCNELVGGSEIAETPDQAGGQLQRPHSPPEIQANGKTLVSWRDQNSESTYQLRRESPHLEAAVKQEAAVAARCMQQHPRAAARRRQLRLF